MTVRDVTAWVFHRRSSRSMPLGELAGGPLVFAESHKVFDPMAVYGDAPNPTQL